MAMEEEEALRGTWAVEFGGGRDAVGEEVGRGLLRRAVLRAGCACAVMAAGRRPYVWVGIGCNDAARQAAVACASRWGRASGQTRQSRVCLPDSGTVCCPDALSTLLTQIKHVTPFLFSEGKLVGRGEGIMRVGRNGVEGKLVARH